MKKLGIFIYTIFILSALLIVSCDLLEDLADDDSITHHKPVANAGSNQTVQKGDVVTLDGSLSNDPKGEIISYLWTIHLKPSNSSLEDGNLDQTSVKLNFQPDVGGVYELNLRVANSKRSVSDIVQIVVTASDNNSPPSADAGTDHSVLAGDSVSFEGSDSYDIDGYIVKYEWDFGDGNTSSLEKPAHKYADAGEYTVILKVTDDEEATDSDVITVTVTAEGENQPPVADAGGDKKVIIGNSVELDGSNSTDPDGSIASYYWDFGDGNSDTSVKTTHTFEETKTYIVKLTVTDNDGATNTDEINIIVEEEGYDPIPDIKVNETGYIGDSIEIKCDVDDDDLIVYYTLDFGDGSDKESGKMKTSDTLNVYHTYEQEDEFTIILIITDEDGNEAKDTEIIKIIDKPTGNEPPKAVAGKDREVLSGKTVTFNASESKDPDGKITSYSWFFYDDETRQEGIEVKHTFTEIGTHKVHLTVTDDKEATGEDTISVKVVKKNIPPKILDFNPEETVYTGEAAKYTIKAEDPDGKIVSIIWNFGDKSNPQNGGEVGHVFKEPGAYEVTVVVTDNDGASLKKTAKTTVTKKPTGNNPPVAVINKPIITVLNIELDGSNSSDSDGKIIGYEWTIFDQKENRLARYTGPKAEHTFKEPGSYKAVLVVIDDDKATDTDDINLNITNIININANKDMYVEDTVEKFRVIDNSGLKIGLTRPLSARVDYIYIAALYFNLESYPVLMRAIKLFKPTKVELILNWTSHSKNATTCQIGYIEIPPKIVWTETSVNTIKGIREQPVSGAITVLVKGRENKWDLTELSMKWLEGPKNNNGLVLKTNTKGSHYFIFADRENRTFNYRPVLRFTF